MKCLGGWVAVVAAWLPQVAAAEPASDRAFTTPTALTVPDGNADISFEVERNTDAIVRATVGVTPTTELSVLAGKT